MKSLLVTTALALTVFAGSPSTAQVIDGQGYYAGRAFAQAPVTRVRPAPVRRIGPLVDPYTHPDGRVHSVNPGFDVYGIDGRYISSDPDPFIRNELRRAPPDRDDN